MSTKIPDGTRLRSNAASVVVGLFLSGTVTANENANEEDGSDRDAATASRYMRSSGSALLAQAQAPRNATIGRADGENPDPVNGTPPSDANQVLEEIIVTARYRDESSQDIGLSLMTLSGSELEDQGIESLNDIATRVPNLNLSYSGPNKMNLSIRGLANAISDNTFGRNNPLIGMFLDDISIATSFSTQRSMNTFDLEAIEVLRGPQGTLYGEGSMGGALRYRTNSPDLDDYSAKIRVRVSTPEKSDDIGHRYDATLNLPIITDVLGLRLTGFWNKEAGYIDFTGTTSDIIPNVVLEGVPKSDANEFMSQGIRAIALATPTDDLSIRFNLTFEESEVDAEFLTTANGPDLVNTNYFNLQPGEDDILLVSGRLDYSVGNGTFTSITGYVDRDRFDGGQEGGTSFAFLSPSINDFDIQEESFSQELRFVSSLAGRFNFLTGLYFKSVETTADIRLISALDPSPGTVLDEDEFYDAQQIAAFGELSFDYSDQLRATFGLRYFEEEVDASQEWFQPDFLFSAFPDFSFDAELTIKEWLPKLLLEYKTSDDALLYGSVTRGARNGGLNQTSTVAIANAQGVFIPRTYNEDSATSYEAGVKSQWLDGRLIANAALFYIAWEDLQARSIDASSGVAIGFLRNVGDAVSQGVEVDVVAEPTDWLNLALRGAYTDATLDQQISLGVGVVSIEDARIPNTPEYQISIVADVEYPLGLASESGFNFVAHADYQLIGPMVNAIEQTPETPSVLRIDDYSLANIQVGVDNGRWGVYLFSTNLFDERVFLDNSLSTLNVTINPPRTVGLMFKAGWN